MASGARLTVLLVLVVGVLVTGSGVAATDTGAPSQQVSTDAQVSQQIVIDLQQDGDARWTITKQVDLSSENETEAFDDLATDFENNETDHFDATLAAYRRASTLASESTGRQMQVQNVTRQTRQTGTTEDGTGYLSISFTWTSFGRLDGNRFHVDDVFTTRDGLWFSGLTEQQRLVIRPPENYEFYDAPVRVTLRNGTIQWTGPTEFDAETLQATFERNADPTTPTATPTTPTATPDAPTAASPTNGTTAGNGGDDGGSLLWMGLFTLGIGALAVVGYLLQERGLLDESGPEGGAAADDSPTTDDGGAAVAGASADSEDEKDDGIDEELLSDEERVERLLEENGGRMKQANIVKETGWSNAKVSQLLSAMEEDGEIDKLRIGRENLISFPDEDVADFDE